MARGWALLLLALVSLLCCHAEARAVDVVGGDRVAEALGDRDDSERLTRTKTTVTTVKHARVAATIETTRIVGSGVPASAQSLEQCSTDKGDAQCAQPPARALQDDQEELDHDRPVDSEVRHVQAMAQQMAVMEMATRHVQELQDQVNEWLPKLQAAVASVVEEITRVKVSLVAKWRVFQHEWVVFYDHFLADTVDALGVLYHKIAVVVLDAYNGVRGWAEVVAAQARELWETHEEVRVVTHHVVSLLLLALLGAVFFSVYALVATVPDTVSAMWTSLDDLTRAQLKIVFVLVTGFAVYHLRALWSFWLLLGSVVTFYYWSGHVLAKTMGPPRDTPLTRQPSSHVASTKLKAQ